MIKLPKALGGYSLVEIVVVIALFAITSVLVTTAYVSFDGREKLKNAALQLKGDIRYAQAKAQAGDKDAGSCPATSTLGGWYITVDSTAGQNGSYLLTLDCLTGSAETSPAGSVKKLPSGVNITQVNYGGDSNTPKAIFFQPQGFGATFHASTAFTPTLNFFSDAGVLNTPLPVGTPICTSPAESCLIVTLSSSDGSFEVIINDAGKVYEKKI